MSLIKSAGTLYREGKTFEDHGDLKKSMFTYYQAIQLASMAVSRPEKERLLVQREIDDFFAVCQLGLLELLPYLYACLVYRRGFKSAKKA